MVREKQMIKIKELYTNAERAILKKDEPFTKWARTLEDRFIQKSEIGDFQIVLTYADIESKITRDKFSINDVVKVIRCIYPDLKTRVAEQGVGFAPIIIVSWDIHEGPNNELR